MLRITGEEMKNILQGQPPDPVVVFYGHDTYEFSEADYLIEIPDLTEDLSDSKRYEVSNMTVRLRNRGFFFSRLFFSDPPFRRVVAIRFWGSLTIFRGVVSGFALTPTEVTLTITA